MSLEHFEILIRNHYHTSLALLEQMKRGVDLASTDEGRREAEERYRQMLQLHQRVEEKYRRYWETNEQDVKVNDYDISDS